MKCPGMVCREQTTQNLIGHGSLEFAIYPTCNGENLKGLKQKEIKTGSKKE